MGLYEVLKAAKIGAASDVFTTLRGQQAPFAKGGSTEHEYTGAVPYTFTADGEPLLDWYIKGNTVQNGTPTPQNPVDVVGVGERTGNLWNVPIVQGAVSDAGDLLSLNTRVRGEHISVQSETQYTISCNKAIRTIYAYLNKGKVGLVYGGSDQNTTITFTTPANCDSICVGFMNDPTTAVITPSDIEFVMLNTGSTARPYEPYGYKIPIICGGTITTVYIGTNPLMKSLDGTAADELSSNGTLTQRVDTDGSVLPTPILSQIDTPTIPTNNGINTFDVETAVKPSEIYIKWKG